MTRVGNWSQSEGFRKEAGWDGGDAPSPHVSKMRAVPGILANELRNCSKFSFAVESRKIRHRRTHHKDTKVSKILLFMAIEKVKSLNEMVEIRLQLRAQRKRLVFTNGCFDILHVGHVRYLNEARAMGDKLAVGLNSDESVRKNKGEGRPIVPAPERAEVLAALACVDYVFLFDEPTPERVIDAIVPDVLVKGADWGISEIVGRDTVEKAGGVVKNIPLTEGASTTKIIRKILQIFGDKGN